MPMEVKVWSLTTKPPGKSLRKLILFNSAFKNYVGWLDKSFNCSQYQATHILKLKNTAHYSFIHLFFHYQGPTREKTHEASLAKNKDVNNNSSTNFLESLSCLITVVIYPPPNDHPCYHTCQAGESRF